MERCFAEEHLAHCVAATSTVWGYCACDLLDEMAAAAGVVLEEVRRLRAPGRVVVTVRRGVAEVEQAPEGLEVVVHDEDCGEDTRWVGGPGAGMAVRGEGYSPAEGVA